MSREQSMRNESGVPDRALQIIAEAQDWQAMDVANRGHADLEVWAGGPMRRINERHHEVSTGPRAWVVDIMVPLGIGLVLFAAIWGTAFLGELFGGWPL